MLIFLKKVVKSAATSGDPLPNPLWPPAAEGLPPDHRVAAIICYCTALCGVRS